MRAWASKAGASFFSLVFCACPAERADAQTSDLVSRTAFRVCADPANYPMSTKDGTGWENGLAELFADRLELPLRYTWFPQATGFVRQTLRAKKCDVIMAYAQGHELVQNTNHYFTSVYTLIVPAASGLSDVKTLADPALRGKAIGIVAGSPPATHMARNGLIGLAKSYQLFVDRRVDSPTENMLYDLESGAIDAAILWGPIGGPLVKARHPDFKVIPLIHETLPPKMHYRITMGVRLGEKVWQRKLNSLIRRNQDEIDALLIESGVPLTADLGDRMLDMDP